MIGLVLYGAFLAALGGICFFTCVLARRAQNWGEQQSLSPDPCRACGERGWHYPGCGLLDRLDAPALPTQTLREIR